MANLQDAEQLRNIWDPEHLGTYEGKWIAFRKGQVENNSPRLAVLADKYATDIQQDNGPLFAFVTFEATV